MSRIKRLMEEQEGKRQDALGLLQEVGAIEECEIHDGITYEGSMSLDEALDQFEGEIEDGSRLLDGETLAEFKERLSNVYNENAADECYACAKNRDSD